MKRLLLIFLAIVPMIACAQTESKYLEPLTLKDGRITFETQLNAPTLSQKEIYDTMLKWANDRFKPDEKMNAKVVYTNEPEGQIVVLGEEYIVFSSSMLSLDRTRIYYQLEINCLPEKVAFKINKIKYWYNEGRDGGERYKAEEWISDKMAVNKAKTKLLPISGKFRRETIDLKDELVKSAQNKIGGLLIAKNSVPDTTPKVTIASSSNNKVTPQNAPVSQKPAVENKVIETATPTSPEAIIEMANRITITSGNDEQFEIGKECWGGFGKLFGKDVTFCLIDTQKTMANMLLSQNDNYTISFYVPGKQEAAYIVKCKKMSVQSLSGDEANKMNSKNIASKKYNMYVGEIF